MGPKPNPEDIAGGQAILEGVMMRHGNKIAAAVRRPDKQIVIQERTYIPLTKRYKILGWMFIRGTVSLFEMMVIGIKCLMFSAEVALSEEERKPKVGSLVFPSLSVLQWQFFLLLCLPSSLPR